MGKRQSLFGIKSRTRGSVLRRSFAEFLEPRVLLSTNSWKTAVSGDYDVPGNWTLGHVPTSTEDAVIIAGSFTVTHSATTGESVHSLTTNAPLTFTAGSLSSAAAVTENSNITLGSASSMSCPSLAINGGHVLQLGNAVGSGTLTFNASAGGQTLSGTGQVLLAGPNPSGDFINIVALAASPFTIGAGIKIHGAAGNISDAYGQQGIVNLGTISADALAPAGQVLTISGLVNKGTVSATGGGSLTVNNFSNTSGKTISVAGGGTLTLGGAWTNAGTISENASTLNLGGTFSQSKLGTLTRTGGTVNLTGIEDLGGGTLALTAVTGSWRLLGGTVKNGTISFAGGGQLITTSSGGTLDTIKLASDLVAAGGTSFTASNSLTLLSHNVTLGDATGEATLTINGTAAPSLAGTGQIILAGPSPSGDFVNVVALAASPLTIAAGITIHGAAGNISDAYGQQGIVNLGTIKADAVGPAGQVLTVSGFINKGSIQATSGGSLTLNTFVNTAAKTISIAGGGTLALGGSWSNAGIITETASKLVLGGTFTQAALGTLIRTGGTIDLTGTDDLAGGTLAFTAVSGSWNLRGGTVKNATLTFTGGNSLLTTNSGGTLDHVTLASDFVAAGSTSFSATNGLTLSNHSITLGDSGGEATLTFSSSNTGQTIAGTGQIILAGPSPSGDFINIVALAASPLTIGAGITIHGPAGNISDAYGQQGIVNLGTISADAVGPAGQVLSISGIVNKGTIQAINSGSVTIGTFSNSAGKTISVAGGGTLTLNGAWSNAGIISQNASKLVLGGTFTQAGLGTLNRTAGTIDLTGIDDVGGGTLAFTATTGSWNLRGGTVRNGTITFAGGSQLVATNSGGMLDKVKLGSDWIVPGATSFSSTNGLTLLSHNLTLGSAAGTATMTTSGSGPGQTLTGTGQLIFAGPSPSGDFVNIVALAASPFTIGAGVTIHGPAGNISDAYGQQGIVNMGTIIADAGAPVGQTLSLNGFINKGTIQAGGGKVTLNGTLFTNQGTLAAISSDILSNISTTFSNTGLINIAAGHSLTFNTLTTALTNSGTGVLAGTGTIVANVVSSGTVSPGPVAVAPASTIGTLHITGKYTQSAGGTLKIELGGATSADKLAVTGAATLTGLLDIYLVNSFHPAIGNKFNVLSASSVAGNFSSTDGTSLGAVSLTEAISANQAVLTTIKTPTDTTAPTFKPPLVRGGIAGGATAITFTLTFADNVAIDVSTFSSGGITVTNAAHTFTQTATLVSVNKTNNGLQRTATFKIIPPGDTLDKADNSTYTVSLLAGKIKDTSGLAVAAGVLGTFAIALP